MPIGVWLSFHQSCQCHYCTSIQHFLMEKFSSWS